MLILNEYPPRPENPVKWEHLADELSRVDWIDPKRALRLIFKAVDDLAHMEMLYYYRRRVTKRAWSFALRFLSWVLGTIGLLCPLLAAALDKSYASYGYISLGLAASSLAADSLFDVTPGHQRFAKVQLSIEAIRIKAHVAFSNALRSVTGSDAGSAGTSAALSEIVVFADKIAAIVGGETIEWSKALEAAVSDYRNALGHAASSTASAHNRRRSKTQPQTN